MSRYQKGKWFFAIQASEKMKFGGRNERTMSTVGLSKVLIY